MRFAGWPLAIALAIVVPFIVITAWIVALNHPTVMAITATLGVVGDLAGLFGYVAIAALGFSFILRCSGWQDLELPERQLLVGIGLIYFTVTSYLMFYWGFVVVSAVYGRSL